MVTNPPQSRVDATGFAERRQPGSWIVSDPRAPLVAFSSRLGGVSDGPYASLNLGLSTGDRAESVAENRRRLLADLGVTELATVRQVHGAERQVVERGGPAGVGDVLVTTRSDLALAVSTADCLPVALWDEARTVVAVVHAGWRGTLAGALESALQSMAQAAPGARLSAALGPSIRACCFEVGPEVAERFPASCLHSTNARPRVDLARAAVERLAAGGVHRSDVLDLGLCTFCTPGLFYSHRRDHGVTGRHWALVRIEPASFPS